MKPRTRFALFIVLAAVLLAVSALTSPVWYDDACHFLTAQNTARTGSESFPVQNQPAASQPHSLFITTGPVVNYLNAAALLLFGDDILYPRLVTALFSLLLLGAVYIYGLRQNPKRGALAGCLLLLCNLQFLTYGAQVLGEIPALCFALWGFYFLEKEKFFVALPLFWGSILCKEYLALPIGLTVLAFFLQVIFSQGGKKEFGKSFQSEAAFRPTLVERVKAARLYLALGCLLPFASVIYYFFRFQSFTEFQTYWALKSNYQSEFLSFHFAEPFGFIVKKPIIVLGWALSLLKIYWNRSEPTRHLILFFQILFINFIFSAGYDRFGVLLIALSAIFVGELVAGGYEKFIQKESSLHKIVFFIVFFALFAQQTPYIFLKRIYDYPFRNLEEKQMAAVLEKQKLKLVYTPELTLIPFLSESVAYRLPVFPPCLSNQEKSIVLRENEGYVSGIYSRTEYSFPKGGFTPMWQTSEKENRYELYKK